MARENKKPSFNFGYTVTLLLLLLLAAGAVLLLIPSCREYRKKKKLEAELRNELERLQTERTEKTRENNDLRTSREATEKVSREKFNQVGKDEIVIKYTVPEQGK